MLRPSDLVQPAAAPLFAPRTRDHGGCFLFVALGAFALASATTRPAAAQNVFGTLGQLVVTAEDLFELSTQTFKVDVPGASTDYSDTTSRFGFLYSGRRDDAVTVQGPKVGGHYFVVPSLSVGGTIGFESRGGSTTTPLNANQVATVDKPSHSSFLLAPKIVYSLMFNPIVGRGPGPRTAAVVELRSPI